MVREGEGGPGVSLGIDGGEGHAAVEDFEPRLELEHQGPRGTRRHGLGEADDSIMGDDSAAA